MNRWTFQNRVLESSGIGRRMLCKRVSVPVDNTVCHTIHSLNPGKTVNKREVM